MQQQWTEGIVIVNHLKGTKEPQNTRTCLPVCLLRARPRPTSCGSGLRLSMSRASTQNPPPWPPCWKSNTTCWPGRGGSMSQQR